MCYKEGPSWREGDATYCGRENTIDDLTCIPRSGLVVLVSFTVNPTCRNEPILESEGERKGNKKEILVKIHGATF